jgi:hypothetical protein
MNWLFNFSFVIKLSELKIEDTNKIYSIVNLKKSYSNSDFYLLIFSKLIKDYDYILSQFSNIKLKSGKSIRELKIEFSPIYWIFPFSYNHPNNHFLFSLFLLRNYLDKVKLLTHQNFIYRLQELAYLNEFIQAFFCDVLIYNYNFHNEYC